MDRRIMMFVVLFISVFTLMACGRRSAVDSITLDTESLTLVVGEAYMVDVTVEPGDVDHELDFSSRDNSVATFNDALIEAIAPGETTLRVSAGGVKAEIALTVVESAADAELQHTDYFEAIKDITLEHGATKRYALNRLAPEMAIRDEHGRIHFVGLDWSFDDFDGQTAGSYQAHADYELPVGVIAGESGMPAVTATVHIGAFEDARTHSTYSFAYDFDGPLVPVSDIPVSVDVFTALLGENGYENVRFQFKSSGPGHVIFVALDLVHGEITYLTSGNYPFEATTLEADAFKRMDWTMAFSVPGTYEITFTVIDGDTSQTIAENTFTKNVRILAETSAYRFVTGEEEMFYHEDLSDPFTLDLGFMTRTLGKTGYENIRFRFESEGDGDIHFEATDTFGETHRFENGGFYGGLNGYTLHPFTDKTLNPKLTFSDYGTYTITVHAEHAHTGEAIMNPLERTFSVHPDEETVMLNRLKGAKDAEAMNRFLIDESSFFGLSAPSLNRFNNLPEDLGYRESVARWMIYMVENGLIDSPADVSAYFDLLTEKETDKYTLVTAFATATTSEARMTVLNDHVGPVLESMRELTILRRNNNLSNPTFVSGYYGTFTSLGVLYTDETLMELALANLEDLEPMSAHTFSGFIEVVKDVMFANIGVAITRADLQTYLDNPDYDIIYLSKGYSDPDFAIDAYSHDGENIVIDRPVTIYGNDLPAAVDVILISEDVTFIEFIMDGVVVEPLTLEEALLQDDGDTVMFYGIVSGYRKGADNPGFFIQSPEGAAIFIPSDFDGIDVGNRVVIKGALHTHTAGNNERRELITITSLWHDDSDIAVHVVEGPTPGAIVRDYPDSVSKRYRVANATVASVGADTIYIRTGEDILLGIDRTRYGQHFDDYIQINSTISWMEFTVHERSGGVLYLEAVDFDYPSKDHASFYALKNFGFPESTTSDLDIPTSLIIEGVRYREDLVVEVFYEGTSHPMLIDGEGKVSQPPSDVGDITVMMYFTLYRRGIGIVEVDVPIVIPAE